MAPRYRNWKVRGYKRTERDADGTAVVGDVVEITEPGGWQWHLVVKDGQVLDYRMLHTGHRLVDTDALKHAPLADLARMAMAFHERVLAEFMEGTDLSDALDIAEIEPGEVRLSDDSPAPEEFARAWLAIPGRTVDGTPRREALAERFGVTVWAIDKWARGARERGLIPRARTGRPRGRANQKKN
ncbi:MAG: hypothetical protein LCH96_05330 [Actinobacteria bacterium]|nr:hypothetical protein [Actinomycetota bacterium]